MELIETKTYKNWLQDDRSATIPNKVKKNPIYIQTQAWSIYNISSNKYISDEIFPTAFHAMQKIDKLSYGAKVLVPKIRKVVL